MREKLGESLVSVQKFNKPLEQATTSSLEALSAYTRGRREYYENGDANALPHYKRAIELDPNFARAYASLGTSYSNLNQASLAIENYKKAFELRDRVSERERFYIESNYYMTNTGELEKAIQSFQEWIQAYPSDDAAHLDLGYVSGSMGQFEKALSETREALRLEPDDAVAHDNILSYSRGLGRLDEAKAAYEDAVSRKLDAASLHQDMYYIAFLENDSAAMNQHAAWAMGKPGAEDAMLSAQSDTEAYFGRLSRAREFSSRAVESARHAGTPEAAGLWQVNAALHEVEFGNLAQARKAVADALALSRGRDVEMLAALALARAGDPAQAQKLADKINQQFPLDTFMQSYWLPTIGAAVELDRGNAQRAVDLLQAAMVLNFAFPQQFQAGPMYPAYLRGQANLKIGQRQQAALEFQKMIDHRGLGANFHLGPLAHLGLARAYALSGDMAKARTKYQDFFALWKDADPDIPILKEAKAEYEKLK